MDARRWMEYVAARPLVVFAPAAIVGVAAADRVSATAAWWWGLAGAAGAAVLVSLLWRRTGAVLWACLGVLAGFARYEWAEYRPDTDLSRAALPEGRARVRGIVEERPRLYSDRARALTDGEEGAEERASGSFTFRVLEVEGRPDLEGRVRVQFYDRAVAPACGEELLLSGKLHHPRPKSNPGGFDRRRALARQGIGAILVVGERDEWRVVRPAPTLTLRATIEGVRGALRDTLHRHAPAEAAALMSALLIGTRENLSEDLVSSLQRSGTAHFLAISGQNLAIVLALLAIVFTVCGVRGPSHHGMLIVLLLGYTALSGWEVSVVRAFLMAALMLGARWVWRKPDAFNALCAAAAVIVLVDPAQAFQAGFQLSFLAVIGILFVSPIFHEFAAPAPSECRRWWHAAGRQARMILAVSVAAWLATAPVVLAHFNLVTPVILAANLALVPLILLATAEGMALLAVAPAAPPLADLIGSVGGLTVGAIRGASDLLVSVPGSHAYLPALPGWGVAAYYGALLTWTAWARRDPRGWRIVPCVAFAAFLGFPALARHGVDGVFVAVLDVGRGSASYVEFPDGRNLVFDCGSLTYRDPGAAVVAPYLWSRGVRRVDTLVLSHADFDHVNGARSVIERMGVRRLVVPRTFEGDLVAWARSRGVEVVAVERAGPRPVVLGPDLEVLAPPVWEKYGREAPANEASLVLRVAGRVLLTGDIEERGTAELLELGGAAAADVLVVPHHGKRNALHDRLAAAVGPKVALVSAPDGYYASEVIEHLERSCRVYRTGRDGCIEVTLREGRADVQTHLAR